METLRFFGIIQIYSALHTRVFYGYCVLLWICTSHVLASAEVVTAFASSTTLYYTEDLSLTCECKGIPRPSVVWEFNEGLDVFTSDDPVDGGTSGDCNNLLHASRLLHWSEANDEAKKISDGESVTCRCGGHQDSKATTLDVQCKIICLYFSTQSGKLLCAMLCS